MLSKPTLITLPLLLLVVDYWPLQRSLPLFKIIGEKWHYFIVAILGGIGALVSQAAVNGLRTFDEISLGDRLSIVIPGYLTYLGKFFWPFHLSLFYPQQLYYSGVTVGALIALLSITYLCWQQRATSPSLMAGWLWFIISLLPMIGIVSIGGQMYADRWTYIPHIGILIGGGAFFVTQTKRRSSSLIPYGVGIMSAAACIGITLYTLPYWKTSTTIFRRSLEVTTNNFLAHTNLAVAFIHEGNISEASSHLEEALRIHPQYPEALNNLGIVRVYQGRLFDAKALFERAIHSRPTFTAAQNNLTQVLQDLQMQNQRSM